MGLFEWLFGGKKKERPAARPEPAPRSEPPTEDRIETLKRIVRQEMADEVAVIDFGTVGLPLDVLKNVKREVVISIAQGSSWRNCKAKNYLPQLFPWKEWDDWMEKIKGLRNPPDMIEESMRVMYPATLHTQAIEQSQLRGWKERGVRKVKLMPAPDACSLCKKMPKVYPIDKAPMVGKGRHPGCRCAFMSMD